MESFKLLVEKINEGDRHLSWREVTVMASSLEEAIDKAVKSGLIIQGRPTEPDGLPHERVIGC